MKVLSVMGSPRKAGNTATVLGWIEQILTDAGHEVDHLDVVDYEVGGCTGCNACKLEPDSPACTEDDDMTTIYERLMDSDLVLVANPLYCWGYPSQLKAFFDRCYALAKIVDGEKRSLVSGKQMAFVVTAAGPYENNIELLDATFPKIAKYLDCAIAARLFLPFRTKPEELGADDRKLAEGFSLELIAKLQG